MRLFSDALQRAGACVRRKPLRPKERALPQRGDENRPFREHIVGENLQSSLCSPNARSCHAPRVAGSGAWIRVVLDAGRPRGLDATAAEAVSPANPVLRGASAHSAARTRRGVGRRCAASRLGRRTWPNGPEIPGEGTPSRVRTCVRLRTLRNTNKNQHGEKCEPHVISRNVRKTRGLAFGRLVFVGVCLVGTPGFEPSA
jgi:hypothetical protein